MVPKVKRRSHLSYGHWELPLNTLFNIVSRKRYLFYFLELLKRSLIYSKFSNCSKLFKLLIFSRTTSAMEPIEFFGIFSNFFEALEILECSTQLDYSNSSTLVARVSTWQLSLSLCVSFSAILLMYN